MTTKYTQKEMIRECDISTLGRGRLKLYTIFILRLKRKKKSVNIPTHHSLNLVACNDKTLIYLIHFYF